MSVREKANRDLALAGSIVGGIFAALVGTDVLDLRNRSTAVAATDRGALALWILSLLLFLLLSAFPTKGWLAWLAGAVTGVAGLVTVVAVVIVISGWSEDHDTVRLALTPDTEAALTRLCSKQGKPLEFDGSIATSTLADEFVVFTFEPYVDTPCDQVRIPRASILSIREHPLQAK